MIDAIVIGAGHNGLVAAAYLGRAGFEVLVLEGRAVPGGACVTEETFPGYKFSTAAYAAGLLRPRIIRELGLKKYGLRFIAKDPQYFLPYPDGKYIFLWSDLRKSVKEIAKLSKRDAKAYVKFSRFWERFIQIFEPYLLRPPPSLGELFRRAKPGDEEILRALLLQSASQFLDELFESDNLKASLATQGIIGTFAAPSTPGTLYVMAHHMLSEINGRKGLWGVPKGGMGAISSALAKAVQNYGGTIEVNSEVKCVNVKNGRAVGVSLQNGKSIEAKVVLSNADPKRTFLKLVGRAHLDGDVVRQVEAIRTESAAVKVNLALSELPDYKARPGKRLGLQHVTSMEVAPSMEYLEKAYDDARQGRPSRKPWCEIEVASALDPSVAPKGHHYVSIFSQYGPYHLAKGSWEEQREEYGDRVVESWGEYAPNVEKAIIHRQVLTPYDLEKQFGLTEGNIFHGEILPDQLLDSRPIKGLGGYRTPIKNLYMCGSGTHPGGGVLGAPGYNAAQAVLLDSKQGRIR